MSKKKHDLDYKYPPDIQKCKNHRLATRIFKGLLNPQFAEECQCCQRRIGNKEQSGQCCYDNIKLAFIGPGIPLLFTFIKNAIILLISLVLIFVAFSLYSNIQGSDCLSKGTCSDNIFDTFAIINKASQNSYLTIQNFMLLGFVIFSIFLLQYFRYSFRKVQDQCDDLITSPSDYALILRRLPQGTQKIDIQQMIQMRRKQLAPIQRQKTENLRVVNIIMSFSMGQYTKTKLQNKQEFSKLLSEGKHQQFKPKSLPPLEKKASVAIIVFGRQQSKQLFKYKPNIFQKLIQCIWTPCIPRSNFIIKGQKIAVQRAPQPDDIVWQNTKISQKGAICRKTLYSLFSIVLLFIGGGIQYGLALAQTKAAQDSQTQLVMSTFASIAVSVINTVIQIFLVFTSQKQRNQTITEYNTVLMVKISFFQFLNTGVFVVLANFLAQPTNFSLSKGFVFQVTQVMIINAIIPNISLFILTYCEIIPKIKRCLIERGTIKNSQLQSNGIFQGPSVQIPYKYAYVFKTIWLTAFYAPLSPIIVPVSIFGLLLNYIIQKCLFGKVYSIPNTTSSMVNNSAIQLMQYFPLIISIGEYIIYLYFLQFKPDLLPLNWSIPIYASIAISCLNLLLPMDALNEKLFTMPSDNFVYPSYQNIQDRFEVTYQMTNPGYNCDRKRKRDMFVLGSLFGNGGAGMAGLGMLGLNVTQNDLLETTQNNVNNNGEQNINNMNMNPLGALLGQKQSLPQNQNMNKNPLINQLPGIGIPPNFQNQKNIKQPNLNENNNFFQQISSGLPNLANNSAMNQNPNQGYYNPPNNLPMPIPNGYMPTYLPSIPNSNTQTGYQNSMPYNAGFSNPGISPQMVNFVNPGNNFSQQLKKVSQNPKMFRSSLKFK